LGQLFIKQKALAIDQDFSYAKNLSLISLKWLKVTIQNPNISKKIRGATHFPSKL